MEIKGVDLDIVREILRKKQTPKQKVPDKLRDIRGDGVILVSDSVRNCEKLGKATYLGCDELVRTVAIVLRSRRRLGKSPPRSFRFSPSNPSLSSSIAFYLGTLDASRWKDRVSPEHVLAWRSTDDGNVALVEIENSVSSSPLRIRFHLRDSMGILMTSGCKQAIYMASTLFALLSLFAA